MIRPNRTTLRRLSRAPNEKEPFCYYYHKYMNFNDLYGGLRFMKRENRTDSPFQKGSFLTRV